MRGKNKNHKGKYEPTPEQRRQVMTMTGLGIIQDDIARFLDVDDKTLRKHYRRELDTGAIEANMRVASSLYAMATRDKVPSAAIFWLKARAHWKETSIHEQTGPDGSPLTYVVRTPTPIDSAQEWLKLYGPKDASIETEVEIDGEVCD